ncbi:hypothetical protein [Micromonospora narathiwatensis]|uniref:ABC-2 family transporter protein n=1 Tax=Micromonospora narathiwatensis TaxID=299146 RepID=A0A1A8ZKL3_9ACTN|nr:hypothetical protein [Micromonospora narathiwatensis]SBT44427.1 hypothetical protein GA0070621_2065 [Micromonospora narathiwatensis]
MTGDKARQATAGGVAHLQALRPGLRLARLHLASRRVPVALAAVAACAVLLRVALHWPWDAYGALQLPLIFEAACAAVIAVTTASPFGGPERATGRRLPFLRLGAVLALTTIAAGALAAAGVGAHLAGGTLEVLRNTAGLTGIGLLCAALLGGALAWTGPTVYLIIAVYALYTQWHGPALTTPWIWPARPGHDIGAVLCAGLVFAAGMLLVTVRGARDPVD